MAHMAHLRDSHYTPITAMQLARSMTDCSPRLPDRPVVITFDDGLADFYTGALPVLKSHGFAATLYVVSGCVGGTSCWLQSVGENEHPMLTWSQLADITANGIECGSHTHTHPRLADLPPAAARDEIIRSKAVLEQHLGLQVTSFAYPHGSYNASVRQAVRQAGYSSACAVHQALSSSVDDRFALSRMVVTGDTDVEAFANMLRGRGLPILPGVRATIRRLTKGGPWV